MNDRERPGKSTLSAATRNANVKVRIQAEPAREFSQNGSRSTVSNVEISVDGVNIHVPRSSYADLVDPRKVNVQFSGTTGIVIIDGGDGAMAYLVRIFFDRKNVNLRTLSSALSPSKPTEETRYWLRVLSRPCKTRNPLF